MTKVAFAPRVKTGPGPRLMAPDQRPKLRVLCATDLRTRSDFALQRTLSLVAASNAQSLLLHVVDAEKPLRLAGRMADRAHNALAWRVRQWGQLIEPPDISVRIGRSHRLMAQVARDWCADLIVLGSYRPRTADWLFGTTAERLAVTARCAVLVVNADPAAAYAAVTFAAASIDSAKSLAQMVSRLSIAHPVQPQYRTLVHVNFDSVARALLGSGSDLIVTGLERLPLATRVLRRNMTNELVRRARCDVLIAPTGSEIGRKPHPQGVDSCLGTAAEPVA